VTPIAGFPHAKLYRQAGSKRRPIIVILSGAEGNDDAGRRFGPILAREGYAAVSLPYHSPNWGSFGPPPKLPELPGSVIDLRIDQLAALRDALRPMAGVDVKRFALFGGSLGAEFALIAASRYDWITSVVAYVPSDLVWEGWGLETVDAPGTRSSFSFEGKPLPFMPYKEFYEVMETGPAPSMRPPHDKGRAANPGKEAAARIPIENYKGALMVIAGDKDKMWDSYGMSRNIVATRAREGLRTEALLYPDAGHDLGGGSSELREDPRGGGTASANAAARADSWPKVLAFLKATLKP
jgi:dienelactone hydrolase